MEPTDWRHADAVAPTSGVDAPVPPDAPPSDAPQSDTPATDASTPGAPSNGGAPSAASVFAPAPVPSTRERLEAEGEQFDFFQAVWLLETLLRRDGARDPLAVTARRPRLRLRPHDARVFPPSDIHDVRTTDDGGAQVTATFMGLYGVDSPLPSYFARTVEEASGAPSTVRDFLDLFNHRLYALFYRTWRKYRAVLDFEAPPTSAAASGERPARGAASAHARAFVSLAGLGVDGAEDAVPGDDPLRWVQFGGRLGGHVRNAEGLARLLTHALDGIPAQVEENVPRWTRIRARHTLGTASDRPAALGRHAVVGPRVYDVANKFRVVLGPLTLDQYRALQPGEPLADRVQSTVDLYVPDLLDYDVELRLDAGELRPATLCDPGTRLGTTAWLRRPAGETVSDLVRYPD